MIEFQIDTSRVAQKLRDAQRALASAPEAALRDNQAETETRIDDFMFVPLQFNSDVSQVGNETIAETAINLNVQSRRRRAIGRAWYRRRKQGARRSWKDYVASLLVGHRETVKEAVADEIRKELP